MLSSTDKRRNSDTSEVEEYTRTQLLRVREKAADNYLRRIPDDQRKPMLLLLLLPTPNMSSRKRKNTPPSGMSVHVDSKFIEDLTRGKQKLRVKNP